MLKTKLLKAMLLSTVCGLMIQGASSAFAGEDVESIIKEGDFFGEMRYRYEHADQNSIVNDAKASTVRTNLGFKTGVCKDFQALFEGQIVQNISTRRFSACILPMLDTFKFNPV